MRRQASMPLVRHESYRRAAFTNGDHTTRGERTMRCAPENPMGPNPIGNGSLSIQHLRPVEAPTWKVAHAFSMANESIGGRRCPHVMDLLGQPPLSCPQPSAHDPPLEAARRCWCGTTGEADGVSDDVQAEEQVIRPLTHVERLELLSEVSVAECARRVDLGGGDGVERAKYKAREEREKEGEGGLRPTLLAPVRRRKTPEEEKVHGRAEAHDHSARDGGRGESLRISEQVECPHNAEEHNRDTADAHKLEGNELGSGCEGGVERGHGGGHHYLQRGNGAGIENESGVQEVGARGNGLQNGGWAGALTRCDGSGAGAMAAAHQVCEGKGGRGERPGHDGRRAILDSALQVAAKDANGREEDDEGAGDGAAHGEGCDHGARARKEGSISEDRVVKGV
eukprot:scaffold31464_cov31-Tisochrysis_lutea.AAC.2